MVHVSPAWSLDKENGLQMRTLEDTHIKESVQGWHALGEAQMFAVA